MIAELVPSRRDTRLLNQIRHRAPLGPVISALGAVALSAIAAIVLMIESTGSSSALAMAALLFIAPGLAVICWSDRPVGEIAWMAIPVSCIITLVGVRATLLLNAYQPRDIAVTAAVVTGASGLVRLAHCWRRDPQTLRWHLANMTSRSIETRALAPWKIYAGAAALTWLIGCLLTNVDDLSHLGLLGAASWWWLASLPLLVAALTSAFKASDPVGAAPLVVVAVVAMLVLHVTAPVVYDTARYTWTFKHIGFADYFAVFHDDDRSRIDIYQAWPSFFASTGVIAGVTNSRGLEAVARWWPVFTQLSCLLILPRIFSFFIFSRRRVWTGVLFFMFGNWIGQDYFSPQSLALTMSLAVFACMLEGLSTFHGHRLQAPGRVGARRWPWTLLILAGWVAIVTSHPLTPFLLLPGLLVAAPLLGVKPRWLPISLVVIAVGHAVWHFELVKRQGVGSDFGDLAANVESRSTSIGRVATRVPEFNYYLLSAMALSAIVVLVAAVAGRRCMRLIGFRTALAVVALVVSPALILVVESYGQEGILRAYLFSLPWLCLIAATCPTSRLSPSRLSVGLVGIVAIAVVGLSAVAVFVRDEQFAIAGSDVDMVRYFEDQSPDGGLVVAAGVAGLPEKVTARYFNHTYVALPLFVLDDGSADLDSTLQYVEESLAEETRPAYIAFGPSLNSRSVFDGYLTRDEIAGLEAGIRERPQWTLVFAQDGSHLYQYGLPS